MKVLPWLLVLLLKTVEIYGEEVELKAEGEEFVVISKGYPEPAQPNLKQSWIINSPVNTVLQLTCYDIRLHQADPSSCDIDVFIVDTGMGKVEEICGVHYNKEFSSTENRLDLKLNTGSHLSGGVRCIAKVSKKADHVEDEESVDETLSLKVEGPPLTIKSPNYPNHLDRNIKKSWVLEAPEGAKIRILLKDFRLHSGSEGRCGDSVLKIVDGENILEVCGERKGFTMLSSGRSLRLELNSGSSGGGGMSCEVWAPKIDWYGEATTTEPPPYNGIESEEVDSSEHGGPPGKKTTTCSCGWTNKENARIVGGEETGVNEYPFMVSLVFRGGRYSFCGGTIITRYHALTAAHCTEGATHQQLSVVIGEHDQSTNNETDLTEEIPIAKIIQHEEYTRRTLKHDISLLLLERPIEFTRAIGPVCLSRLQEDITMQYVKNIGWGRIIFNGPTSVVLRKVDTRIIHIASCNKKFSVVSATKPTQLCTYSHEKASCQGDSGGPVLWLDPETNRYTQRGITSFGTICATTDPSVKTDVSAYIDWLEKHIAATSTEELCFRKDD